MSLLLRASRTGSIVATLLSAHSYVNARLMRRPPPSTKAAAVADRVAVCIPARNEAGAIERCLLAVLRSSGVDQLEVLVLDDGSSDATAAIVAGVSASDRRVRPLTGAPLAPGWLGKPHACEQLGRTAIESGAQVLVFVDADVLLEPHAIAEAVSLMRVHGFALVSPYPRQVALSAGERLVQPLLQWLWLTFLPLRLSERTRPVSMAAANGQFLVCDARAYESAGGHASVRDHVVEDVWLARAFKRAGHRAVVVDGTQLATCRMYRGWSEVRDGYTKSLWSAFGGPSGVAMITAGFSLLYLVPPVGFLVGLVRRRRCLMLTGAAGYAAGVVGRTVTARATGGRAGDAPAHPLSVIALIGLAWRSVRHRRAGRLHWRGRPIG